MKKHFVVTVAFVTLLSTICFSQNKPIELKFNLPTGSGFDYKMEVNSTTKLNAAGQDVNVDNVMSIGYAFKVIGDSAGWKKLSSTISQISLNINTGGMNINYDSDKPIDTSNITSATLGKVLGVLKGSQFMFTMNKNGDIGSVSGMDEMMTSMMENAGEMGTMAGGLTNAFSENNFKQNLKQVFGMYPGKPVKPGDTWTNTTTSENNGANMKMENSYTLASIENNLADVNVSSKISADSTEAVSSLTGTMTGAVKFDVQAGIPVDGDLIMKLAIVVTSNGQTMPIDVDIKMKVTGKKS